MNRYLYKIIDSKQSASPANIYKRTKQILPYSLLQETIENEFIKCEIYLEICKRTFNLNR